MVVALKVKMSGSEKNSEQEHVRHFLHKRVSRKFLEVLRCIRSRAKQQKSLLYVQSCFFAK